MPKLRVHNLAVSLDGYAAGASQTLEAPMGVGGERLHKWVFATRTGRAMIGETGGSDDVDEGFMRAAEENIGATIMGRNMFGPVRGPWPDESWQGWWGDEPPYHHPVFVLIHHERPPLALKGTTFHFVTGSIESVLVQAVQAADGKDVRLGGGTATIQQYLRAGLVDSLHVAVSPTLLYAGERLLDGEATKAYEVVEVVPSAAVTHYRLVRTPQV
jgi:dihydrofolate reductase